jgi:hypothetical protein
VVGGNYPESFRRIEFGERPQNEKRIKIIIKINIAITIGG